MFLFFDIDETLLDQRRAELAAAESLFATFGDLLPQPCSVDCLCLLWRECRERHLPAYLDGSISYLQYHRRRVRDLFVDGDRISDREADARYRVFRESYRRAWRLFDDVRPALEHLAHLPKGIISNGNSRHQRRKLRDTGILGHFAVVVISDRAGAAKPRREIFLEACRRAGVPPSRCVYIGDRIDSDVHASQAAGMRGIWLDRNNSRPPGGIDTIRSLADLPSRIGNGHAGPRRSRGVRVSSPAGPFPGWPTVLEAGPTLDYVPDDTP